MGTDKKNIKLFIVTDIKHTRRKRLLKRTNITMTIIENQGISQYNVTFEPHVYSNEQKSALLHQLDNILGATRCFDGTTMFLPKMLPDAITTTTTTTTTT